MLWSLAWLIQAANRLAAALLQFGNCHSIAKLQSSRPLGSHLFVEAHDGLHTALFEVVPVILRHHSPETNIVSGADGGSRESHQLPGDNPVEIPMLNLQALSGTASGGRLHQVAGNCIEMGQRTAREKGHGKQSNEGSRCKTAQHGHVVVMRSYVCDPSWRLQCALSGG
jgi:hypothetical protein